MVSVQQKNSSVLKTPVLTHQARSSAENQRTPMEKTRTWLQRAAPSETGAEETFLLSGGLKNPRLGPGECNSARARSAQGAGWGWGLWRSPQEEPQPWGAGRAGSGVAQGALTLSPRLDEPSGGMCDITLLCSTMPGEPEGVSWLLPHPAARSSPQVGQH